MMTSDTTHRRPRRRIALVAGGTALALGLAGAAVAQSPFVDIEGNTHEDAINRIYDAGITEGRTATTYAPRDEVRRDQMASFLSRTIDHIHPPLDFLWFTTPVDVAIVLPDGTTLDDEEPPEDSDDIAPGTQFFATSDLWTSTEAGEPDEVVGTETVTCTFGVEPFRILCDGAWEVDGVGTVFGTTTAVLSDEGDTAAFDVAITGGTGAFFGATGEALITETAGEPGSIEGTLLLHNPS
jgi:hypothetical protein